MTVRAFFAWLLSLPLGLACGGCALLKPDHVTVYLERSESETAGDRKGRTTAVKEGVSATFNLSR